MKERIKDGYKGLFPRLSHYLERELKSCETALDLGCGPDSPLAKCSVRYTVGVEVFEPYLEKARKRGTHSHFLRADIRRIKFKEGSFDAVLALDLLEHLTKEEGLFLVEKMQSWARKKVIIFTSNGGKIKKEVSRNTVLTFKMGISVERKENRCSSWDAPDWNIYDSGTSC